MNLDQILEGSVTEYCIACFERNQNMFNLAEHIEKRNLFTIFFKVELSNFKEYPNFLCDICYLELNRAYNFCQNVRKNLETLENYNNKTEVNSVEPEIEPDHKQELYEHGEYDVPCVKTKKESKDANNQKGNVKLKIVDPTEVENVIEEFKRKFTENKICIICGFAAANRRSISTHMAIFHKEIKNSWCLDCNEIFENFEEHKENHSSRYSCPFCQKKITVPHYIEHLRSHSGTFECKECNKNFKSAAWLTKHSRIHTNEKPYICPNCYKGFIQLSSLRYHLNTHGKYSCDECKKHFKTENTLKDHECTSGSGTLTNEIWVNTEEGTENEIEPVETIVINGVDVIGSGDLQNFCKDCNKRVKSLKQHVNKYHTPTKEQIVTNKKFRCEFCQKIVNSNYKLQVHIRTHTGQLPYKCKFCDRRTLTRSRLLNHERSHTKEKPYICNVCGKALSQASVLKTHMRQHTGRPELCNLCGKAFCRKSQLKLHLSKHMGERPFLCTNCGKTFAQKSHLSEHMASHTQERPFGCSYCAKNFKTNNLLREHLKLHQGYKPFQCPVCPYACYKAYRLQQHMKQHNGPDEDKEPSGSSLETSTVGNGINLEVPYVNNVETVE